ncbi:MAG: bifunctional phosphoglucose/phosphomannose isomerase [Candidatus Thermoplasmatota archaeon]|nr:bifunctional phosphoglucose/phosphomannose isomerase [Candidatus Thermoplasmatota archaeon]
MILEEPTHIDEIDKDHMIDLLHCFPEHIEESRDIIQQSNIPKIYNIQQIIFTGMGGSAISGDIIQSYLREKLNIPIIVNRTYDLPKWANKHTLVIAQSYSGNTEETLSSFKLAHQRSCPLISISSGGKLKEYCQRRETPFIQIPSGYPPRSATGYLLFCGLFSLKASGILQTQIDVDINETIQDLKEMRKKIHKDVPLTENCAKQLAIQIGETIPQIYGWGPYGPIAKRWATQFNENSKLIARYDTVPECNHNDIVGWAGHPSASQYFTCILLRDPKLETIQMKARLEFMKRLLQEISLGVIEVEAQGKSILAKMMHLMYLGDYISCYTAVQRQIDPSPVAIITQLKEALDKI